MAYSHLQHVCSSLVGLQHKLQEGKHFEYKRNISSFIVNPCEAMDVAMQLIQYSI